MPKKLKRIFLSLWLIVFFFIFSSTSMVIRKSYFTVTASGIGTFTELRRLGVGQIEDIAMNPEATMLAIASGTSIRLYDPATLESLGLLEGHTDTVLSVTWSPDGEMLASGSRDGSIKLWNPVQAEEIKMISLPGDTQWVYKVTWSPNNSQIAAAGSDFIIVVDVSTGTIMNAWAGRRAIAWSPDGSMLAHGNDGGSITLLSTDNYQVLGNLTGQPYLSHLLWSPDGTRLASASQEGIVYIWDTETLSASFVSGVHQGWVQDLAWFDGGSKLITADGRYNLYLWEPESSDPLATWGGTRESFADWTSFNIELSADGATLFSGGANGLLEVWNMKTHELERSLEGHNARVMSLMWSPDGGYLASFGDDDRLYIWDTESWTPIASSICQTLIAGNVTWSPDGQRLALSCEDFIMVLEIDESFALRKIDRIEIEKNASVAWSPDSSKLVSGSHTGYIQILDAQSLTLLSEAAVFSDLVPIDERPVAESVIEIVWSPDGKYFATATTSGRDLGGSIEIWDADGNSVRVLDGYFDLAWSASGNAIAGIAPIIHNRDQHIVTIWDVETGIMRLTTLNQEGAILSIAWAPNNRYMTTSARDRTIRFFDTDSGTELQILSNIHPGRDGSLGVAHDLAWSPDGLYLASAGDDGTVAIWGEEQ